MEIILSRIIPVASYQAVATIGKEDEEFRFLLSALELAGENGGFITPEAVNESLVFLPPEHEMGKRILGTLEKYKHIQWTNYDYSGKNGKYELTELGKSILSTGRMMIPEKGPCVLHTIIDPLFPENIVGCEHIDRRIHNEYDQALSEVQGKKELAQRAEDPFWLNRYPKDMSKDDPKMIDAIALGERIIVYEIERPLIPVDTTNMALTVTVTLNAYNPAEVKVTSNKNGKEILVSSHHFIMSYEDVLRDLLAGNSRELISVDTGEYVMLSSFEDLTIEERNRMTFDHIFKRPDVIGFGYSLDVHVKGIRILPKTMKDAIKWATHLLINHIDNYIDREAYDRLRIDCASQFSESFPPNEILKSIAGYEKFLAMVKKYPDQHPNLFFFTYAPVLLTADRS